MAKRGRKKKEAQLTVHSDETKIFFGLVLAVGGLTVLAAPFFDAQAFRFVTALLGFSAIPWGITLLYLSLRFFTQRERLTSIKTTIGLLLFSLVISTFLLFWTPKEILQSGTDFSTTGGTLGYNIHLSLVSAVGQLIEFIVLLIGLMVSISMITNIKMSQIRDFFEKLLTREPDMDIETAEELEERIPVTTSEDSDDTEERMNGLFKEEEIIEEPITAAVEAEPAVQEDDAEEDESPRFENWKYPSTDLLQEPVVRAQNKDLYKKNALVIEQTLRSFGVQAKVVEVSVGPTVVQYALSISVGTKVAKVRNLANDLALALAAPSSSVRIEAPIPGTSLVGVEAPNPTPNFVYAKELISKLNEDGDKYELPLIMGKDVSGKMIIHDLAKLPHLLVAGATGTGKSIGINSMLLGLLMTKSPDQVRFILVDPKMVEMAPYNGIPHLLTPVITDMELVVNSLQWATEEMSKRYRLLKQAGVRKITEYNQKMGFDAMPYIIIVIDEMADLMLSTGVDVESRIVRLAQMSRAVGIHLILATQRPSVDVITGLIKANIPGRMAFAVTTAIDSRVIIDQIGAESLLGNGDMLFKSPERARPIRVQGTYTDIKDLDRIMKFIKDQVDEPEYSEEITSVQPTEASTKSNGHSDDPMFRQAAEVIINAQRGSASLLQRKLKIGYNRAARLMDELENAGIVGPAEGSNPRKVLVSSVSQVFGNTDSSELPQ
jgi:S-DNA-T family DNA segregation ATPase FtsK/SpoIIIE